MGTVAVVSLPAVVTAPDTNSNEVVIAQPDPYGQNVSTLFIQVLSGTFQFNVGSTPGSSNPVWGASDTIPPITIIPNPSAGKGSNLFFTASSGGSQFRVTR